MAQPLNQFAKYILLEKIATGGMAEVYLAKSAGASGVNKFVAIKRILPQLSGDEEFINMFKEEAKIAVNLQNSNIVQIFEFGVEEGQFYLVMEYVEGRTIRQILTELKKEKSGLSIDQIVYIVKEVAKGLDYAHRCHDGATAKPLNITHRDMSPQNVMVSFEGEVKIIDFGIAKTEAQTGATKTGVLKGKYRYMSPEQASGGPLDMRTDIFSLGIVLWELLADDRLFNGDSEQAILRKIRDCHIPSIRKKNPEIPIELERILVKCLMKEPGLRYLTAGALTRDLNRFLNTQYPDFSPNEFSIFIKSTFSEQIQKNKKNLIEYAKIQFVNPPIEKISVPEVTHTELDTRSSMILDKSDESIPEIEPRSSEQTPISEKPKVLPVQHVDLWAESTTNDFTKNSEILVKVKDRGLAKVPQESKPEYTLMAKKLLLASEPVNSGGFTPFSYGRESRSWLAIFLGDLKSYAFPMGVIIAVCVFIINSWVTIKKISKNLNFSGIRQVEAFTATDAKTRSNVPELVRIDSTPSAAKVFIDNIDIGKTTPCGLTFPEDREYLITIKKEGYSPFQKRFRPDKSTFAINVALKVGPPQNRVPSNDQQPSLNDQGVAPAKDQQPSLNDDQGVAPAKDQILPEEE